MKKITLSRVNGCGKINGRVPRNVLERNALDYLTCDDDSDFNECLEYVEEASTEELINLLADAWGE